MNSKNNKISQTLRHIVFERDSYTCVCCDQGASDIHHVFNNRNVLYNLVSLCRKCHGQYHGTLPITDTEMYFSEFKQSMFEQMCDYLVAAHPREWE